MAKKHIKVTKGMRNKGGYWYKNSTLIERLAITEKEQEKLEIIINTKEKYKRKNENRVENRRNKNGLTKKQQELQNLKVKVIEMKKESIKNKDRADKLNISIKILERHITNLKKEGLI